MAITVTAATQGAGAANGILLRIFVLAGAGAVYAQEITSGNDSASGASSPMELPVTTTTAGSVVYGAMWNHTSAFTADVRSLMTDNYADGANSAWYGTVRGLSPTGTPGAATYGASSPGSATGGVALWEVVPAAGMTITEDTSAPAAAVATGAPSVTSPSFTPLPGGLMMALIAANGNGAANVTATVTDTYPGGLGWIPMFTTGNSAGQGYSAVWMADIPPASVSILSAAVF